MDHNERDQISRSDFYNWMRNPVTQVFLEDTLNAIDDRIARLITGAGLDPLQDRWNVGYITGLRQLADWNPNFKEEEVDVDGTDSEGT